MKHFFFIVIILLCTPIIQTSFGCDIHGKTGIVAKNNLNIPVGLKGLETISEAQFNKVIDRIESLYRDLVTKLGGNLVFNKDWNDGTVNAYAHRDHVNGKYWFVTMLGGIARHPQMNEDALAAVACHELGHHLGGFPKTKKNETGKSSKKWVSSEGQADYYSSLKCLRNYFSGLDNSKMVKQLQIPTEVTSVCQKSFINSEEIAVCQRSAMAGLTLAKFFQAIINSKEEVKFSTPDKIRVSETNDSHPSSQCRLDTIYNGAICDKSVNEEVSDTDANSGTCTTKNGDKVGLRPACWFFSN